MYLQWRLGRKTVQHGSKSTWSTLYMSSTHANTSHRYSVRWDAKTLKRSIVASNAKSIQIQTRTANCASAKKVSTAGIAWCRALAYAKRTLLCSIRRVWLWPDRATFVCFVAIRCRTLSAVATVFAAISVINHPLVLASTMYQAFYHLVQHNLFCLFNKHWINSSRFYYYYFHYYLCFTFQTLARCFDTIKHANTTGSATNLFFF